MKKIDIIYNADLRQVQGINYVTNSFVKGKSYLSKTIINKIYSPSIILNIENGDLMPIGANVNLKSYKFIRKFRTLLKILLSSDITIFAMIKFYLNIIRPAKKVVNNYILTGNADFIIFQDIFSAYFYYKKRKKNKQKTIIILHSGRDPYLQLKEEYPGLFTKNNNIWINRFFEFSFEKADKIVYISKQAMLHSPISNKTYIYNGVPDIEKFSPKIHKDKINIVCIGSMNGRKGQDIIIDSVHFLDKNTINRIHVYFVGSGTKESELKESVTKYNLNDSFSFLGNRNDVDKILTEMDILILPSISEGLPMTIIEALRQGLYILTTDTGGTSEMIGEGFGEIITRNPLDLSIKISEVINKQKLTTRSSILAREHYENNFRLETMIKKYEEVLTSI